MTSDLREKIRKSITKDFNELYVKSFMTNWKTERLVRSIDIGIMPLDHLADLFEAELAQAVKESFKVLELDPDKKYIVIVKTDSLSREDLSILAKSKKVSVVIVDELPDIQLTQLKSTWEATPGQVKLTERRKLKSEYDKKKEEEK